MAVYIEFRYGLQAAYDRLDPKDNNALYFISDTRRIYKGDTLIASKDYITVNELPNPDVAISDVFYVVNNSDSISINILSNDKSKFIEIANSSSKVTSDNIVELTNKTINADSNTIKNLNLSNFIEGSICTVISKSPTDDKLVTEKAVSDAITGTGSIVDVDYDTTKAGDNAVWTFTSVDGTKKTINTPKEVFLQSASYDNSTKQLTLTLNNSSKVEVDMSTLVPASMSTEDIAVPTDKDIKVELGTNGVLGGYKTGDTIVAGTNINQILTKLLAKQVPPTYTQPSVSISNNSGSANASYEIGTTVTPKLKVTFNKNDAGKLTQIIVKKNNVQIGEAGTTSPYNINDTPFVLSTTTTYVATASYAEGSIKNDNLGDPYPTGHIAAGSKTSNNYTFTPYRQGYFYGVLSTSSANSPLTSDIIRGLNKSNKAYAAGNLALIRASSVANPKRVIVACPATNRGVTKVVMPSAMNADCTKDFVKVSQVSVKGASNYEAIPYNVWVYEPASISSDQTFTVTLG